MNTENGFLSKYKSQFKRINEELNKVLDSRVTLLEDIGKHSLVGQGKRIRPLFFLLSCNLCNYQGEDLYRLSTIFECIHTASLLHDDVLDNADVRRNRPSANHIWGNASAVLEGDFLVSKSLSIAVSSNNFKLVKRLIAPAIQMVEGQVMEIRHTNDLNTSKEDYMKIIRSKTGVLISAACACGAIISGSEVETEDALAKFGMNAGIAFQLRDDLLDYTSSREVFGKPVGKDLQEGKITLPLIYAIDKMDVSERERLEGIIKHSGTKCTELIDLVRNNGVLDRIREEAQSFVDKAAKCLAYFPDSTAKRNLLELNQFIVEREY
jgi:octaprenyl-diphosphate synthase